MAYEHPYGLLMTYFLFNIHIQHVNQVKKDLLLCRLGAYLVPTLISP